MIFVTRPSEKSVSKAAGVKYPEATLLRVVEDIGPRERCGRSLQPVAAENSFCQGL